MRNYANGDQKIVFCERPEEIIPTNTLRHTPFRNNWPNVIFSSKVIRFHMLSWVGLRLSAHNRVRNVNRSMLNLGVQYRPQTKIVYTTQ